MAGVPIIVELLFPVLECVRALGGSSTNQEMLETVIEREGFSQDIQDVPDKGGTSKLASRIAGARQYLREMGLLENSARGVWSVTESGEQASIEDIPSILEQARDKYRTKRKRKSSQEIPLEPGEESETGWREQALEAVCSLSPAEFEHLAKRILREAGFVKVEVTGKSGDGGIDGTGILKMNLLSFHVYFQCKKYDTSSSIGSKHIRDFRGALQGRGDKGLFITTTSFSSQAKAEAIRDGAPPIDLVDGEELCNLLKEYGLGVRTEQVEAIEVDKEWFSTFGIG